MITVLRRRPGLRTVTLLVAGMAVAAAMTSGMAHPSPGPARHAVADNGVISSRD
jgi:hypothetical protein